MTEYSPGFVRPWHGKWQGNVGYRESPEDRWKQKAKNLKLYHEADPEHPGQMREVMLPEPTGRITKKMTDEAEKALKEWRDELIGMKGRAGDSKTTVAQYVTHYLDTLESNRLVEPSTLGVYRDMQKTIARYDIGFIKIDDLKAEDAEAWISQLVEDGRAHSSIRKSFNVLHAAVKHAVSTGHMGYDSISSVKTPKIVNKEPNSLDDEMRAKLVSYLDIAGTSASNVGFSLALYTGMREGEICGLRWRDVDLEERVIHVRNVIAHRGNACYEKEPKTRSGRRDIPFSEELVAELRLRRGICMEECSEAGVPFSKDMYVIGHLGDGAGRYMHPHVLWRDWKAVARSLGLKGIQGKVPTFHDLRHTYATVATHLRGTDLKSVQMNLGHASIKTTVDIYASDNPEARRAIADATVDAIREVPKEAEVFALCTGTGD